VAAALFAFVIVISHSIDERQKLAAKATTTASQIRIPKAQESAGTPASCNGRSIAVVVMGKVPPRT